MESYVGYKRGKSINWVELRSIGEGVVESRNLKSELTVLEHTLMVCGDAKKESFRFQMATRHMRDEQDLLEINGGVKKRGQETKFKALKLYVPARTVYSFYPDSLSAERDIGPRILLIHGNVEEDDFAVNKFPLDEILERLNLRSDKKRFQLTKMQF